MRVGYACVNTALPSSARTTRLANATPERLRELTASNLAALGEILRWNAEHGIRVFRITSNLVPFASHPVHAGAWREEFAETFGRLGRLAAREGMRLSTHPGQYTVLGSARAAVVEAALAELEYHARLLKSLGLGPAHKIVLHLTGDPGRFREGFARLSEAARARLVLENDERRSLAQVVEVARTLRIPVVFDVFHHELNPSLDGLSTRELVLLAAETWADEDGRPEIHFSTQEPGKRPGAHAETLDGGAFACFADEVGDLPVDCVLELKDKERSALRAIEILAGVPA